MEVCLDNIRNFIIHYHFGGGLPRYSPGYNLEFALLYLAVLGWAFFHYWVLKNRRGQLPLHFWLLMALPPLGSMALLTYYSETAARLMLQGTNIYMEGLFFALFLSVLNLFTFFMYVRLLAYSESLWRAEMLQEQLNAYAHRISGIEDFQKQTREMRHEFKNTLFSLNIDAEQGNLAQVKQRTQELLGDYKRAAPEHYTGISLIDAVIAYKAVSLRELGTALDIQADLLDVESPVAYDIAAIMGIALDNVIDACGLLRESDKTVRCVIKRQKKLLLVIHLTNPLPAPLRYKNGEIISTKAESGHGMGLSALRRIAQKYGGQVSILDDGGIFSLTVTLFV